MTASLLLLSLLPAQPAGVSEVRIAELNETITLRADVTAEKHSRGRWDRLRLDEPAGTYRAKLAPREFARLATLPGVTGFDQLKENRIAFPSRITRFTVARDGGTKTLEWRTTGSDKDPEQPTELWTLDLAVRGIASRLDWEPVASGVRVRFGGASADVREVMVREEGTNYPIARVRSRRAEVVIPCVPGRYSVEVSTLTTDRWTERAKTPVVVEADRYADVTGR